jgi:heme/copper-type cytochrome/quinol oxidase subunit 2
MAVSQINPEQSVDYLLICMGVVMIFLLIACGITALCRWKFGEIKEPLEKPEERE